MNRKQLIITVLLCIPILTSAQYVNTGIIINDTGAYVSDYGIGFDNMAGADYRGTGGTFDHAGDFNNDGSFQATAGVDNFIGIEGLPGLQSISGSVQPTFYDLNLDNGPLSTFAITNTMGAKVDHTLGFNNGIITTVRGNTSNGALEFGPDAGYSSRPITATHHVNGYVTKTNMNGFTFPMGNGIIACPITVNSGASPTDKISLAYLGMDPTGNDPTSTNNQSRGSMGPGLVSISPIGFWDVIALSGSPTLNVTVQIPGIAFFTTNDMRLTGWNKATGRWEILDNVPPTGNTAGNTFTLNLPTEPGAYSAFAIGSISEAPIPLHLSFTSFTAAPYGTCDVVVNWTVAEDERMDYYRVEHSTDAFSWKEIKRMTATSKYPGSVNYQMTDNHAPEGKNYYRIAAVSKDGSVRYTPSVQVNNNCEGEQQIIVHPTLTTSTVYVELPAGYEQSTIRVLNGLGQIVPVTLDNSQQLHRIVRLGEIAAGTYLLQVINQQEIKSFKVEHHP